jgi:DNA polymerase I-like protein with 3'-5' exonuclease and polymerase domains
VLSRLSYPDRPGHSLEWWGDKLKFPKGNHKDFSKLSQEMLDYCIQDVNVTRRVHKYLQEEMKDWDWSKAIQLEYAMQHLQTQQEMHGVLFDVDKAEVLVDNITKELEETDKTIISNIPLSCKNLGEIKKPFLKNGSLSKAAEQWVMNGLT